MFDLGGRANTILLKLQQRQWWPGRAQPPQVTLAGKARPGLEPGLSRLGAWSPSSGELCRGGGAGLVPALLTRFSEEDVTWGPGPGPRGAGSTPPLAVRLSGHSSLQPPLL